MTWPLRTIELKSAFSSRTTPETCVPTSTVSTASRVPVALTASTMSPRLNGWVVTTGSGDGCSDPVEIEPARHRAQDQEDECRFLHTF